MIIKMIFIGGPHDGRVEHRALHPHLDEIRVLLAPPLPKPTKNANEFTPIRTGRYTITQQSEGIAVFRWQGITL